MSAFSSVQEVAPIEVFHVNKLHTDDPHPSKVNLSIGAYRSEEGKPWVLPVVREAEKRLAEDLTQNHEYLPILGFEPFTQAALQLLLGDDSNALREGRVLGAQCLSGTGSLRVGAEFLARVCKCSIVYVSSPTWGNHKLVFKQAGFSEIREHRYWDQDNRRVDIDGMVADLDAAPEGSVLILHGCAHNPTGLDPSKEEWMRICDVVKKRKLIPFLDIAYQGFASGDPDLDAWAVRYFDSQRVEMLVAQSFAKNLGLYNERVGNLSVFFSSPESLQPIKSQLSVLVRANWSNPPNHGAKIVHMILTDPELKKQWLSHIQEMSGRIRMMRKLLREQLETLGTPGSWAHITQQIGMFSYTGLNENQCKELMGKYHIYLLKSGRINVCGLNTKNVGYVAKAFDDVVRNIR